MKNRFRLIALIVAASLTPTACSHTEQLNKEEQISELSKETGISEDKLNELIENEITQKEEQEAIDYFQNEKENISQLVEGNEKEKVKEAATIYLTNAVDFIFNDKEINNQKFSDLTTESKAKIIELTSDTNEILEDSGLKDIIIISADKTKQWTQATFKKTLGVTDVILKELLEEETYKKTIDGLNKVKEKTKSIKDALKEYLKNN